MSPGQGTGLDGVSGVNAGEKDEVEVSPETTLLHQLKAEEAKVADCMVSNSSDLPGNAPRAHSPKVYRTTTAVC